MPRIGTALTWCALAITSVGAFLVRILNHPQVFTASGVRILAGDALYHMRRVEIAVHNGLNIPEYDAFMNFPQGFHCNWPQLFDQCIAGIAMLIGRGDPSEHLVAAVGALLPPILGALTVPALYPVARAYVSRVPALLACVILAVLPFHVQISVLGRPDHHVAVVLVFCLLLGQVLALPRQTSSAGLVLHGVLAGFFLFIAMNIWVGSLLFVVILALHFLCSFAARIRQPAERERIAAGATCMFLSTALFMWPVATRTYWARIGRMKWDALCDFHVLLPTGCAVGFLLLCVFFPAARPGRRRGTALKALALTTAAGLGWMLGTLGFFEIMTAGPGWVLKGDPMLKHVVETMPLSWRAAQENFTRLVVLFPLLTAIAAHRTWRRGKPESAVLLTVWTVIIGICALSKERFSDLFSLNAAILIAFAVEFPFLIRRPAERPEADRTPAVTTTLAALVLVICIYAFIPTFAWLKDYSSSAPRLSVQPLYDLCDWLRQNTEAPTRNEDGSEAPGYSVLAGWQLGNALVSLAGRANVANNFLGWEENAEANLLPYRFAVSDNPEEVAAMLTAYRVRYIIVGEPVISGELATAVSILGLRHEDFFGAAGVPDKQHFELLPRGAASTAVRLYIGNGLGLSGFTLVHESREKITIGGLQAPAYKIFKYTPAGL